MKISRALNLIIPVEREGGTLWVHATPIADEVFQKYFLVISKAFAAIYGHGIGNLAGSRVAAMMLKQVATEMGVWDGPEGVENGLMAEVRRLSNVLVMGPSGGWEMTPLQSALDSNSLDAKEVSEVENLLVFFMVASAMHRANQMPVIAGAVAMWDAQISSQSCTELLSSLRTSTETASSGAKAKASSIPS